jgi:Ca-activated chloride channel family protein
MAQIASLSGGRTFNAQSADELSSIYKQLGTKLGSTTKHREITVAFAVGGLVLLLLAAAGSSRWTGRLP